MPDVSTNSYTLSEVAHIVEVDEKTLHLYAHKGLLNPTLLSDSNARFTDVDCARLKMIKRASEIGYNPEAIFNLIGEPDQVLNVDDPFSACQQFAMERYKQIFEELGDCEPLEQLNKKCDLKLLKSYLNSLDGREEAPPQKRKLRPRVSRPPQPKVTQTQTLASEPEPESARTPRVLSYSVDKLWDYVKSTDDDDDDFEQAPQEKTLPLNQDNHTFQDTYSETQDTFNETRDTYSETFSASPHIQRVIGSRWWSTSHEGYRKIMSTPQFRSWLFSLLILALAVTGVVRIFIKPDAPPQTQIASDTVSPEQSLDTEALPPTDADKDATPIPETDKPEEQRSSDQKASLPDEKTTPEVSAADKTDGTTASEKTPTKLLQVRELSIWHDSLNDLYRADFTIVKNIAAQNPEPVSGYVFIHLKTKADMDEATDGLLLPRGELEAGRPSEIRRGASFSIRNLIKMRVKTVSTVPPESISDGKLLVYSPEGNLLLDQPFKVPIQPFFSPVAEKPQIPGDDETAQVVPRTPAPETTPEPVPEVTPEPRPETTMVPEPQIAEKDPLESPPQPETQDTSPAVASTTAPVEERLAPVETIKPLASIKKTDHPDAAIWEQKSYDAAVNGNFDRAIADATKAIELDPGRVNPYINRSWAYIEKNMLGQAINDCKIALHLDPNNTFAYNNRGLAFQRSNQVTKAQNDYRKACELGLDLGCQNLNSLVNQSRIAELIETSKTAFKAKNWDGVIRATTAVIELDPQNSVAYTNRSAAYAQKNYLVKALKDSNEAIKHDPQFSLAYNNRGYVFELLGNNRKAAADYLKSCSLGLNLGCKNFDKLN